MSLLRWSDNTLIMGIRNESIHTRLEVTPIEDKMRENYNLMVWACGTFG